MHTISANISQPVHKECETILPYFPTIMKQSKTESALDKRLHADFRSNALPIVTEEEGFLNERCQPAQKPL